MDKKEEECKHPPKRLYAWYAYDNTLCIGCCECGKALKGGLPDGSEDKDNRSGN